MRELETRLKMKNVNHNIMSVAIAKNILLEDIMALADREVDGTLTCECAPVCSRWFRSLIYAPMFSAQHVVVSPDSSRGNQAR